jgi:hypothetical protein
MAHAILQSPLIKYRARQIEMALFRRKEQKQQSTDPFHKHRQAFTDRRRLHKEANKAVDQNLMPGEPVLVIITGAYDQAMIGTDRRVLIFKKGMMGGTWFGQKVAMWDYRQINGVTLETGRTTGSIALQVPGSLTSDTSYWDTGRSGPGQSPNMIPIANKDHEFTRAAVADLQQLIMSAQSPGPLNIASLPGGLFCPQCGTQNHPQAKFCTN